MIKINKKLTESKRAVATGLVFIYVTLVAVATAIVPELEAFQSLMFGLVPVTVVLIWGGYSLTDIIGAIANRRDVREAVPSMIAATIDAAERQTGYDVPDAIERLIRDTIAELLADSATKPLAKDLSQGVEGQ